MLFVPLAVGPNDKEVAVAVAIAPIDITIVVEFVIEEIVVPAYIFGPDINWPATIPVVLDNPVIVVPPAEVFPVNGKPTEICVVLFIDVITVPDKIPVPETPCPTVRPVVLESPVMVLLPSDVVPDKIPDVTVAFTGVVGEDAWPSVIDVEELMAPTTVLLGIPVPDTGIPTYMNAVEANPVIELLPDVTTPPDNVVSNPLPLSHPRRKDPLKSGTLNVVEPSPVPHVVLIFPKSPAYVEREYAVPSAASHPAGQVFIANDATSPGGCTLGLVMSWN
jgi:hypothetical protein